MPCEQISDASMDVLATIQLALRLSRDQCTEAMRAPRVNSKTPGMHSAELIDPAYSGSDEKPLRSN